MFVLYNEKTQKYPIKVWLNTAEDLEPNCLEQAFNIANLPFLHKWAALMPDTHAGMGMPIGGVIATKDVIIPNAVGSDIGCGMAYVSTSLTAEHLRNTHTPNGSLLQAIIGDLLRNIPVGFNRYKQPQSSTVIDDALKNMDLYQRAPSLIPNIENSYYQVGTLGGGNHFIELQEDEAGLVSIMLHSGSRHLGNKICGHFHGIARTLNQQWFSTVPDRYRLAFLPTDTPEGQDYIAWMNLALDFAYENRAAMLQKVQNTLENWSQKYFDTPVQFGEVINCHHNYAALEHHFDQNVWVHRKGAIRVRTGDIGIIPGAMGANSYIVEGLGNPNSFHSCSHGAGRKLSRSRAKELISVEEVMTDLKTQGVILGKQNKADVAEEARMSYKDIDQVIENQLDLIQPVKKLKTIGVVKG